MRTVRVLDARNLDGSVRWLGAGDNLGHVWKLPRRQLNKLLREEEEARRASMVDLCRSAAEGVPN